MKPYLKLLVGVPLFWYPMSIVHELGHVISASINKCSNISVIWRYYIFSETLRDGSAHPIIDICSGPIMGIVIPVGLWLMTLRYPMTWFMKWFMAVCLLGNGLYIGLGPLLDGGDGSQLIELGIAPIWLYVCGFTVSCVGLITLMTGDQDETHLTKH